MTNNKNN